ncbi:unnamed protein product [Rotaria sordida]|uniref:Chitin-binding type-2 domain-containing protein n=1 Tax=Rotaria sordida TaxID=392033 RepID=A0A815CKX9_9BILA|nr:unnamed protein product [Rotaria sordida]CAF1326516.1 unnamed protein product [Rotaria sordida]
MQLLNHHKRPCSSFSFGYVIIIIACFILKTTLAEYDCSAKQDGWYYDPEFCHIYWRCIHGSSEEFECASGTAWDHHENRCNWLDNVDCSRSEKTTAKLTSEDDENEQDDDNETKDDKPIVVVTKSKRKKKKKNSNKRMLDGDEDEEDIDPSYLTVCQASSSAEIFCAGRDGFFANPDYCTRYYRCAHGVDQGFECPKGTAWDEETRSCAWIDQVNCDQKKVDYSTSTTTEDTTTSRKKSDTDSVLSEPSIGSILPSTHGKDSSGGLSIIECQPTGIYTTADPLECNAYYQCDKGIRTRLNCPERQLFDADKRQCMEYERVFCGSRAANLADKNQCINKRDGIHPDTERDCHFYYQCVAQNKMREAKCPGDQKFSSYTGKCGPGNNAPMPCGTYIPGSAIIQYHRNIGFLISSLLTMIFFLVFDL